MLHRLRVSTEGLGRGGWGGADWMLLKELSMAGTVLVQIWTDISLPTRPPEGCHRLPSAAAYQFTHGWFVHQLLIMFQIEEKSLAKTQLQRFWLKGRLMVKLYCIFVIELKAVIIYMSFIHPSSIVSCLSGSTSQGQQSKHTCPNISLLSHLILGSSQAFPGQLTDVISPQSASIWPCLKHLT